jgi:DNA invertase Pin-like site-specific DNA recombinase
MRNPSKTTNAKAPGRVRLVGYARVSTEEQRDEGVSLAAQIERLRAYGVASDVDVVGVVVDPGVSGKVPPRQRTGLARVLAMIDSGEVDGVVALKLDRISRSVRDVLDLADSAGRHGWRLVSVSENLDTGSATGRFTLTILAALAQLEREQIGERTQVALDHVAREGRVRSHRTPFGFQTPTGKTTSAAGEKAVLVEHAEEQAILDRILAMRESGLGARRIVGKLTAAAIMNPRTGGRWTPGTIAAILRTVQRRESALAA